MFDIENTMLKLKELTISNLSTLISSIVLEKNDGIQLPCFEYSNTDVINYYMYNLEEMPPYPVFVFQELVNGVRLTQVAEGTAVKFVVKVSIVFASDALRTQMKKMLRYARALTSLVQSKFSKYYKVNIVDADYFNALDSSENLYAISYVAFEVTVVY